MNNTSISRTPSALTIFHDGEMYQATPSHPNWGLINEAVRNKQYTEAVELFVAPDKTEEAFSQLGDDPRLVRVSDTCVAFDGVEQGPRASAYIYSMAEDGYDLLPIIRFLERLEANPSRRSNEQALEFVVANEMPISEDGCFLAYKRITGDWKDCYSKTVDNSLGATPSMPRNKVDDDPTNTCSSGFHGCSHNYLRTFWGERLVAVRIDPADVVCVPHAYENSKLRCCKYEVIKELPLSWVQNKDEAWQGKLVDSEYEDTFGTAGKSSDGFRYYLFRGGNFNPDGTLSRDAFDTVEFEGDVYDLSEIVDAQEDINDGDHLWIVDVRGEEPRPVARVS